MPVQTDLRHPCRKAFFWAAVLFLLSMLPLLIPSHGKYYYTGDMNVQYVPFLSHLSEMLHSGGLPAFDWQTGLGTDTLVTYGGYLLSPFSLVLFLLPPAALPYGITLMTAVKMGITAASAAFWCRQYVERNRTAFICGMLYAFSGFQLFNLVYPFMDTVCLFPLLLYAFDKLVTERKRLCFALLLGVNGLTNLLLMYAACVFIMLYYIVRVACGSFPKPRLSDFLSLGVESLAGVFLSGLSMLPFGIAMMNNARAGLLIFDGDLLLYPERGTILRIVQSMLLPPEIAGQGWYFDASMLSASAPALFLPLFLIVGAAAVLRRDRKAWYTRLMTVCAVCAAVPLLNSIFSTLNLQYYARWFFCPVLILVMLTGKYIEDMDTLDAKPEYRVTAAALAVFLAVGCFTVLPRSDLPDFRRAWIYAAVFSIASVCVLWLLMHPELTEKTRLLHPFRRKNLPQITAVFCTMLFFQSNFSAAQAEVGEYAERYLRTCYNSGVPLSTGDSGFYRIRSSGTEDMNLGLREGMPNQSQFYSTVCATESAFFAYAGIPRQQGCESKMSDAALASLLSVKYDFFRNLPLTGGVAVEPEDVLRSKLYEAPGFTDYTLCGNYMVFRNDCYIPMGFTYDCARPISSVLPDTGAGESDRVERQRQMLKAIWLTDEQIEKYGRFLPPIMDDVFDDTSDETYFADCAARAASACEVFSPRGDGFDAEITLPEENLVFFSVPVQAGFTAYVDGQQTEIESVFGGLSAVYVPKGHHSIRFDYRTPGLRAGIAVSLCSAGVLLLYAAAAWVLRRKYTGSNKGTGKLHKP
ncbi:MAG: YfhO family protein [Oscillospiraceae bacterium]|nr:YfhO family protein [Oscillospiraceae bacterium]